jgi:predicted dehydrogenase
MGMMRSTPTARFRLQGLGGSFEKHGFDAQQQALIAGGDPRAADWGAEPEADWGVRVVDGSAMAVPTVRGDWRRYYVLLEEALRTGTAPPVDIADVLHTLDVLEAARRSSAAGSVVTLAG